MSATYHIFYNSDKEIMWAATSGVHSTIITGQKSNNNVEFVNFSSISATGATASAPGVGSTFTISVFKTLGGGATDY